jgi:RHS repeat-associated protein
LALLRGTTTDYYDADGLGSVTSLTASNGSVAQSYTYDSFGNTTNSTGSLTNSFRYTAREFDTETNLYEYRARYYDPGAGRFLSEDPIQFDGGINFYGYTANDPVGLIDPSGMSPAQGNANGFWPPANLDDPALSPIAHFPWPSSGRFYGVGQGPTGGQQCVALTRHFTGLPCSDCWRAGPKVIGNTIPAGTPVATFNGNGRYPQSGNANSGIYVATYPGNRIVIIDQWPPNAVTHGPAKPAGARTLNPVPGDPSDDSGSYSVITVPRGTESSHCKCGNW